MFSLTNSQGDDDAPLQFFDLELITDLLLRDSEELQVEFKRKAETVAKRDVAIEENAVKLCKVEQAIYKLNIDSMKMEMELDENAEHLQKLERAVDSFEKLYNLQFLPTQLKMAGESLHLLEEMSKTNPKMQELTKKAKHMEKVLGMQVDPTNPIVKLLDLHTQILMNLDQKVDTLQDKLGQAKSAFPKLPFPKK